MSGLKPEPDTQLEEAGACGVVEEGRCGGVEEEGRHGSPEIWLTSVLSCRQTESHTVKVMLDPRSSVSLVLVRSPAESLEVDCLPLIFSSAVPGAGHCPLPTKARAADTSTLGLGQDWLLFRPLAC